MNYRQGRRDSLCGFYALTNAVVGLLSTSNSRVAKEVFAEAVRSAPDHVWPACLSRGLEFDELLTTARTTVRRLNRRNGVQLSARPFASGKSGTPINPTIDGDALRLIVWIETLGRVPLAHWSVVRGQVGSKLLMSDSEGLRRFDLSAPNFCGRRARIDWDQSIVVQLRR